jgi:molybdopterin synthase sulfur carrier subunit
MVLPPDVRTVSALLTWLGDRHPDFADACAGMRAQVAVNQTIVRDLLQPIADADEIAFLPPMSGG